MAGSRRMEACVLVKRDGVMRVVGAEDIATSAAMVTALEKGKGSLTVYEVADLC